MVTVRDHRTHGGPCTKPQAADTRTTPASTVGVDGDELAGIQESSARSTRLCSNKGVVTPSDDRSRTKRAWASISGYVSG